MAGKVEQAARCLLSRDANAGGVLASDAQGVVGRAVIDDQDFVAGEESLQGSPQAEFVVIGVQDGVIGGIEARSWKHS